MIKIFSTEKARNLDQYTIENEPISSIDLVERAASVFVREFMRRFTKQRRVIVFAGFGNNGADALAIARMLLDNSYTVETYLFVPSGKANPSPECMENKRRLLEIEKVEFTEVVANFTTPELTETDIIIDGLFGSGLRSPLEGGFAAIVDFINSSVATVVSIDIPSGLFGEDNSENTMASVVRANLTLTFAFPKLAFLLPENVFHVGEWKVLDIGIHKEASESMDTRYMMLEEEDIASMLVTRNKFAHKGTFGHALLVAGSKGKMGASVLAAEACLRSGAGLLTVHVPQRGEQILQTSLPEAMVELDPHEDYYTSLPNDLTNYDAIAVGPGIGQHMDTKVALVRLLQMGNGPFVIDADAINLIASDESLLELIPAESVLTPHPKEFDRLFGESATSYERINKALDFAVKTGVTVVLKGAYTTVCSPNGDVYFNSTGNPGMATAGSGDVLTGIILGLLAQGYSSAASAMIGVYLHGAAGDMASHLQSEESMIAGDITDHLGKAFRMIKG